MQALEPREISGMRLSISQHPGGSSVLAYLAGPTGTKNKAFCLGKRMVAAK